MKKFKFVSVMLSVALLGTMLNFTVSAEEINAHASTRTVYEQDFDNCDWWDNGAPTDEQLKKEVFFSYLNDSANMESAYGLIDGQGRETGNKSLHHSATFKLPFGKQPDGSCGKRRRWWMD